MNTQHRSGPACFTSDKGRPVIARNIKNEWRAATGEALTAGRIVVEIRTRRIVTPWYAQV